MRRPACACWQWHKALDVQGDVPPQPNVELTGATRQDGRAVRPMMNQGGRTARLACRGASG
jgi:hypothetical protein